jgi:hypothetical protein
MKNLDKLYEKLTAEERFKAFIEAAARRDGEELDRLNDTCPMKDYSIEDPAYFFRKTNALLLTLSSHLDAAWHAELAAFALAMIMFGEEKHQEKATLALPVFVRRYRTQMLGFERFCQSIGINPDSLRQAIGCQTGPMAEMALIVTEDYPEADPASDEVNSVAAQLRKVWHTASIA